MHRQAVGAGHVGEQEADVGRRAMRAAAARVERVGQRERGDAPLLGARVVAVQIQPQTRRQLAARPVVLDDGHPGVVDAAVQDQRGAQRVLDAVARRAEPGAMRVGARRLEPGGDDLIEDRRLGRGERQRLVDVAPRAFFLDEAERNARLFQQFEIDLGVGRRQ